MLNYSENNEIFVRGCFLAAPCMYHSEIHRSVIYPVGHKKRDTLLWTITSTFINGFQQLMHQWKKE